MATSRAPFPPTDYGYGYHPDRPFLLTYTVEAAPFWLDRGRLEHVHVMVRWARRIDVAEVLAGTVDNKAGYGSAEVAQEIARHSAALLRQGITHTYDLASWSRETANLRLSWQQYDETRYCRNAHVTSGNGADDIEAWETRTRLYRWLERLAKSRMDDPRYLIEAMRRKGAVALLSWPERERRYGDHRGPGGWLTQPHEEVLALLPVPALAASAA
jgi:hypothetical protein